MFEVRLLFTPSSQELLSKHIFQDFLFAVQKRVELQLSFPFIIFQRCPLTFVQYFSLVPENSTEMGWSSSFEPHTVAMRRSTRLLSCSSDGLLKNRIYRSSVCESSMHEIHASQICILPPRIEEMGSTFLDLVDPTNFFSLVVTHDFHVPYL